MKNIIVIILLGTTFVFGQSLNPKYNTTKTINGSAKNSGDYNLVEFVVKSNKGKELYRLIDKVGYDIPYSKLETFNDGSSVLISAYNGRLTFINNIGNKGKSVKVYPDVEQMYERSIKSAVDGGRIIIAVPNATKKRSLIQNYNSDGNLLGEFKVPYRNLNGIAITNKNRRIFLSYNQWNNTGEVSKKIACYSFEGNRIKTYKGEFEKGFFTDQNQFIGYSNKELISINAKSLVLNFKKTAPQNELFLSATVLNNKIVTATAKNPMLENGNWYFENPKITKIDYSGIEVAKRQYSTNKFLKCEFIGFNDSLKMKIYNNEVEIK